MNEMNRSIFSGMKILVDNEWLTSHALIVEKGKVTAIIPESMIDNHLPAKQYRYSAYDYLVPGFIDLHVHGANGHDVMDATAASHHAMSRALAEEGVTGYLATTMTASPERIAAVVQCAANVMPSLPGAAMLGIHLEGPFIAPNKLGAQSAAVMLPSLPLFTEWQRAANHTIKLVTLAPELPDALPFIEALSAMDIVVSMGHTAASYEQAEKAIQAGCKHVTHLFNAMSGLHQRAPGVVGAALLSGEVTAELIVDGHHLHPAMVKLALDCKSINKLVLVTDAMRAKCMGDGCYELGGQQVTVTHGEARLADRTLAGSTLRMSDAIKNMMHFTGCTLADAISMAAFNPAHVLGMQASKGSIAIGKDADLVVLNSELNVKLTMREGRVLNE